MDAISIYGQNGGTLHIVPYVDSKSECIAIRLLQILYNVTIIVNNSHFNNLDQKILHLDAISPLTYNTILIENCLFENIYQYTISQNVYMISIKFAGFNKVLMISNCTFKNNENFHRIIGVIETEITHSPFDNNVISNIKPNNITIKALTVVNHNRCGFLLIHSMKDFSKYKTNCFISSPMKINGIYKIDVLAYFSGVNVQLKGPIKISNVYTMLLCYPL